MIMSLHYDPLIKSKPLISSFLVFQTKEGPNIFHGEYWLASVRFESEALTGDYMNLRSFSDEYVKHTVLNFGQALQGIRYFYSHPDFDDRAPRGSLRHFVLSLRLRLKRIANDLFFAAIPPHWHHTREELASMRNTPAGKWFIYGYAAGG